MNRLLASTIVFLLAVACGGGATPGQQTQLPGAPSANAPLTVAPQPGGSSNEAKARALAPPGSTEVSASAQGNSYTLIVSTSQTLEQLGAFYQQAIPAAGLTETGRFTLGETLTISVTNPDGGIVALRDPSQGGVLVTISIGIAGS